MNDDIFLVTRDEYVGFLDQIRPDAYYTVKKEEEHYLILQVYSVKNKKLLCERKIPWEEDDDDTEWYYVYEMPDDDERQQPRPRLKIMLETKEEVQDFFNLLGKIQRGELNDSNIQ